MLNKEF